MRDRDLTNGWTGAANGTLEERIYLLENWRADVVALVEPDGDGGAVMLEWVKYSAYGVPFGLPAGDTDSDGDCDATDDAQVTTWKNAPAYDVRGDLNLDGVIDATDESLVAGAHQSLGRGVLTSSAVGNRKGYAGYEGDAKLSAKWHVRHRVLDSVLGRWLSRDPLEPASHPNLQQYVHGNPLRSTDPSGLLAVPDPCADTAYDYLLYLMTGDQFFCGRMLFDSCMCAAKRDYDDAAAKCKRKKGEKGRAFTSLVGSRLGGFPGFAIVQIITSAADGACLQSAKKKKRCDECKCYEADGRRCQWGTSAELCK